MQEVKKTNQIKNVLLIILSILLLVSLKECSTKNKTISEFNNNFTKHENEIKKWKDAWGNEHLTVKKLYVDKKAVEKILREEAKKSNVKVKQIQGSTKVIVTEEVIIPHFDTTYTDTGYLKIVNLHDTLKIDLWDTFSINPFWKRKGLLGLGRKEYYLDIYNKNKYVHFPEVSSTEVKLKKYTIGISPYFGYDIIWKRLSFGVCITPEFFKIRL